MTRDEKALLIAMLGARTRHGISDRKKALSRLIAGGYVTATRRGRRNEIRLTAKGRATAAQFAVKDSAPSYRRPWRNVFRHRLNFEEARGFGSRRDAYGYVVYGEPVE